MGAGRAWKVAVAGLSTILVASGAAWGAPRGLWTSSTQDLSVKDGEEWNVCSVVGENCNETKCCKDWGARCYKKDDEWASCNASCSPKMKWTGSQWEEQNESAWDCEDLSPVPCTANGESCLKSKCCSDSGATCYRKDEKWASCNATCQRNMKWVGLRWEEQADDEKVWDCEVLTNEECTPAGANCSDSRCCLNPQDHCFKKDKKWATCNATCHPNYIWEKLGWGYTNKSQWECSILLADGDEIAQCACKSPKEDDDWTEGELGYVGTCRGGRKGCCTESGSKCATAGGSQSTTKEATTTKRATTTPRPGKGKGR